MRRFALIAIAVISMFSAFAISTSAEAGGYSRPDYRAIAIQRAQAAEYARIEARDRAAAELARTTFDVPVYPGIRPGGVVVAHNPDFPHIDSYANPCTFERVTDIYGRPTPRVVKVCR
jgi:hypothetical protein